LVSCVLVGCVVLEGLRGFSGMGLQIGNVFLEEDEDDFLIRYWLKNSLVLVNLISMAMISKKVVRILNPFFSARAFVCERNVFLSI
jgi:hypothetical protein